MKSENRQEFRGISVGDYIGYCPDHGFNQGKTMHGTVESIQVDILDAEEQIRLGWPREAPLYTLKGGKLISQYGSPFLVKRAAEVKCDTSEA